VKLRSISAIAAFAAVLCVTTAAESATVSRVSLAGGTSIGVRLASELSSSTAREGDRFAFTVIDDVRCEGWLVVPQGARGVGEVARVQTAGSNGHAGKLGLHFDYVFAVDGEKVRVTQTAATAEGEQKKGAASTPTIASYAMFGPLGLFAYNWIKGREASISPQTPFLVVVESTVHINAVDRMQPGDGFAR
jgi:hypothetical protein